MLGIALPIAESSLQVSVKGLKKRLARSQSISGDIFTTISILRSHIAVSVVFLSGMFYFNA